VLGGEETEGMAASEAEVDPEAEGVAATVGEAALVAEAEVGTSSS